MKTLVLSACALILTVADASSQFARPASWLRFGIEAYPVDGIAGIIGPFVAPEDTVYASKYTLAGWKRVRVGMSRAEVHSILGAPQLMYSVAGGTDGPDTGARWSHSPSDTNFRCRILLFRNDVVTEKHSEYYFD